MAALTVGFLASPVLAADYTASDDASLRAAIASANADPDASATIILNNDVTMTGAFLPGATKPITIDTAGYTYTSVYANGSNIAGAVNLNGTPAFPAGASLILDGIFQGATAGTGANGTGDQGMFMNAGKVVVIEGTIAGGAGGGLGGDGGAGFRISGASTVTNNGTVTGGNAVNGAGGLGADAGANGTIINTGAITGGDGLTGGIGVSGGGSPMLLSSVTNSGTIQGGKGATGAGGDGVRFTPGNNALANDGTILGGDGVTGGWGVNLTGVATHPAVLINSGIIQGGASSNGAGGATSAGVIVHANVGTIVNTGTITGGNGAAAVANSGAPISLVNSGTLTAGAGYDAAILMQGGSNLTLELHKGSVINGKVVAATAAANTLILGGDDNAGFDVSTVGSQYQNFTAFQKTGNSTWSLTGTGTIATPWVISQGTLQIGDGTATGSIIGDVTDNGALAFNRSDTVNFDGTISGGGSVSQIGTGTTILTADNTYSGITTISAGTLQLGNGGTTGAILDDVTDNGALAFDRSDAVTFGGAISGSGSVSQIGTGTTTLTANNTYSGGTTITAGTLSVAQDANLGDPAGGLTFGGGTLENTVAFTTNRSVALTGAGTFQTDADLTEAGMISGTGALTKTGNGALILTADNSYTGGTTIAAGTLQLGNGGTSGSILGDVADNDALVFDRSDAVTFGGAISGSGSVSQIGTGTTTLTGVNTYSGGTTISAGTLTGSASSFGTGAILDNAALVINQPANATFANAISGTGSFTKQGTGALSYTGTSALSGLTTVAAGLLSVNGSLANSAVTVQSGATLGGNGTVGATTIQTGGTIAPGNSIGTLHVSGAFAQAAGSVYQVQVDPTSNASDLIAVNGTATLASGAGLDVVKTTASDYQIGTKYTVLSATGGVNGTYTLSGDTQAPSPYLALQDVYDAKNVYLEVVQTGDPVTAAQTPNQTQTAAGTDSLPANSGVGTAVLNTPDPGTTRAAFDQLSGDALASAKGALVSGSLLVRDTTFDRLRDVLCAKGDTTVDSSVRRPGCAAASNRPTVWAQGFGDWGHTSGNANAAGISQSTGGFLVGWDVPVYDWRVGVFGGYSRTDFDVNTRNSSGVSDNYHLGLYGGTQWGDLGVRLGASYSWNDVATDRLVAFDNFSNNLQASYNAGTTQIFGEVGEKFSADQFVLEPFANLAYVNLRTGGFSETGGGAALTSQANTMEDTFTTLGVRPSTGIAWSGFNATLRGMLGWRHTFGEVTPSSIVSFAGSNAFTVDGAPIARDAGVVEAGLDFNVSGNITAGLTYGGQFSSRETDNSVRGTLAITF